MIDRIFAAVLTFALLIGGTLAIGTALFDKDHQRNGASAPHARVVQLEPVVVTGKCLESKTAVANAAEPAAPAQRWC